MNEKAGNLLGTRTWFYDFGTYVHFCKCSLNSLVRDSGAAA